MITASDITLLPDLIKLMLEDPESAERKLDVVELAEKSKERTAAGLAAHVRLWWNYVVPASDPLKWGWLMDALCDHLAMVTRGEINRLLINVPPGCSKSLLTNVFFPSWEWGPLEMPGMQYVSSSYSAKLTERDNGRFNKIVTSPLYQELFPHVSITREAIIKVENSALGFKLATSVGGMGTGERGHRFIGDDLNNVLEAESDAVREEANRYMAEVVPTRLNVMERDAIINIQQRTHDHDVSGMLLDEVVINGVSIYHHFCVPMEYESGHEHRWHGDPRTVEGELAFPERFPQRALDLLKAQLRSIGGDYAEAGQLQQRPKPRGGGMFKEEWWLDGGNYRDGRVIRPDQVPAGGQEVGAWDLAGSTHDDSPYTVRAKGKMLAGKLYVLHINEQQVDAASLEAFVEAQVREDGYGCHQDFPQDPGQAGKFQIAHFGAQLHGFVIYSSPETGDKAVRAMPVASQCRLGNVILVDDGSGWVRRFITQAKSFPVGRYKDQIDALSRLYARLVLISSGQSSSGLGMPALIRPAA